MSLSVSAFAEPAVQVLTPAQQLSKLNITPDKYNETLARMGAVKSNSDRLKWLLAAGADVNHIHSFSERDAVTALTVAAASAARYDNVEHVRLLLEAGTDPNLLPPGPDSCQKSVLALALKQYTTRQETEQAEARDLIHLLHQHGATLAPADELSEQEQAMLQKLLSGQ
jgi:hypothetical protein